MWLRNVIALCPALVCLALAWPVGVDATIYTIAPDGQDLSPCTGEEPCASVRRQPAVGAWRHAARGFCVRK